MSRGRGQQEALRACERGDGHLAGSRFRRVSAGWLGASPFSFTSPHRLSTLTFVGAPISLPSYFHSTFLSRVTAKIGVLLL